MLRRLVEVNSFTGNRDGVEQVARMVEEMFCPLGFRARRIGDHLALERGGAGGPRLLLIGHLDTVYPENFPWREADGRIFGPGVCDMKGGIVVMWMALLEFCPDVTLLFNAAEEGGCADFPPLARSLVTPATRACFVYEPGLEEGGKTTVVTERKGSGRFRVEVTGRQAHSGHSHGKGASAIRELARVVERIEAATDYANGVTFNVGTIEGGTTVNSVPGRASASLDLRAWTPGDFARGRALALGLAGEGSVPGTRVAVTERPGYPPWPANEGSGALGKLACSLDPGLVAGRRGGGSDGCHLWDLVPTLDGLGPVGRNAHVATGPDPESVDGASFGPRAKLSAALFRKLLA
ncbi:MAG TPA: M20/M25/M40 family metallo-hydrolase [Planctomycetota bacterium]|nr:M20/M25/M40 family metallo-hydrolase [Planctomycetota bacterium]